MRLPKPKFKNADEVRLFKVLKARGRNGRFKVEYESETLPYILYKTYIPDFSITLPSGKKVYVEYKGYLRKDDEKKLLSVKETNPDIDLRIVFEKDNRLTGRKMRYSQWCNKHGIPYAVGEVPREWFIEDMELDKTTI